jgi:Tfp pilus assembly protein PilF
MSRGQMKEAVAEFETATRLQPEAFPAYVNAALAYSELNQNDKAEASLRRALSLEPTNAAANLNLGMLLAEMGKMSEAEQDLRAAFKADPHLAPAAYNLGVLLAKDHPEESLEWCRRAAAVGQDNPKYGYTYAFYLHRAGRLDESLKVIRSVRERFPAHEDSAVLEQALVQEQKSRERK